MENGRYAMRPLERPGLSDELSQRLYEAVIDGRIRLGERISEAALSRDLGVSRGPVREAQRQLEQQGLLVFVPRRGFFVRNLTHKKIEDLSTVRKLVEIHAVRQAAIQGSDEDLQRLAAWQRANIHAREGTLSSSQFVERDLELHRLIVAMSGNEALISVFENLIGQIRLALTLITFSYFEGQRVLETHTDLIQALLARETEAAVRAMEEHLTEGARVMAARLAHMLPSGQS